MRRVRLFVALVAVLGSTFVVGDRASATDAPSAVIVVDCANQNATATPVNMIPGLYRATVVGACSLHAGSRDWFAGTPCNLSVPCVQVGNVPSEVCWWSTGALYAEACGPTSGATVAPNGCLFTVKVASTCLTAGTTGFVTQANSGPIHARFEDTGYNDNIGRFFVVLTLVL